MSPLRTSTSALILLILLLTSVSAFAEESELAKAIQKLADRENAMGIVHANTITDPLQKQRYNAVKDIFIGKTLGIMLIQPGQTSLSHHLADRKLKSFDLDPRACSLRLGFVTIYNEFIIVHIKLNSGQHTGQGGGMLGLPYSATFTNPGNKSVHQLGYEKITPKTSNISSVVTAGKATTKLQIRHINPSEHIKELVKYVCPQGGKA